MNRHVNARVKYLISGFSVVMRYDSGSIGAIFESATDSTGPVDASAGKIIVKGPVIYEIGIPADRKFHASCVGH